uniref:6-phosphofructo-2-kinase/fructose-2, 6-bisphosphatase n=1 Tax=Lygus hesperus TaxID=30085 RepID=A0A0A9XQH7_LYGHE
MTYEEIAILDPRGYAERKRDKLNYTYPKGESYKDVIDRIERVIFELERTDVPVIVIAHQAVIRCLYGYFMDQSIEMIPHISVPLHTVIKILPHAYGTDTSCHSV